MCTILYNALESDHCKYWQGCEIMRTLIATLLVEEKIGTLTSENDIVLSYKLKMLLFQGSIDLRVRQTLACWPFWPATYFCTACKLRMVFIFLAD